MEKRGQEPNWQVGLQITAIGFLLRTSYQGSALEHTASFAPRADAKSGWKHRRHVFLLPNVAVEHAEVGGFVEVVVADFGCGFQVSDGSS